MEAYMKIIKHLSGSIMPILILLFTGIISANLGDGLVGQYTFDGNAQDESGNGNHGTIYGANLTTDRFGNENAAYHFSSGQKIQIENDNNFNMPDGFTLSTWIKPDQFPQYSFVLSKAQPNRDFVIGLWYKRIEAHFAHGGTYYRVSGPELELNKWTHVAASWGDYRWKLYVDGHVVAEVVNLTAEPLWTGSQLQIGNLVSSYPFMGTIDDLSIYNRVLSNDEVLELAEIPNSSENLIVNGDFSSGPRKWNFDVFSPADAVENISEGMFHVDIINDDNVFWHIRLTQKSIPLALNHNYSLSFDAKAENARNLFVQMKTSSGEGVSWHKAILTEELQHFEFEFKNEIESTNEAKIHFFFGNEGTDDVTLDNVVLKHIEKRRVVAGKWLSMALKDDGTLLGWGSNYFDVLNIPETLTDAVHVESHYAHALALKKDGTVVAWGYNSAGEATVPAGISDVKGIDVGIESSFVLLNDGTVRAWGRNHFGQLDVPAGLNDVVKITAGSYHVVALKEDGTVVAWGVNREGQTNVPADLNDVVDIASSASHNLALKSDGTIVGWGFNNHGQTDIPEGLIGVVDIAAGYDFSVAVIDDGSVVCWGWNQYGQCDVPSDLEDVVAVSASEHVVALRDGGMVVSWGRNLEGQTEVLPELRDGIIEIETFGENLMHEDGIEDWNLHFFPSCDVTESIENGMFKAEVAGVDGTDWHTQLMHFSDYQLKLGNEYKISFKAKVLNNNEVPIIVKSQIDHDPWSGTLHKEVTLTQNMENYEISWIQTESTDTYKIGFFIGGEIDTYYFDDIIIEETGSSSTQPTTKIIQLDNTNGQDGIIASIVPNNNYGDYPYLHVYAWTQGGTLNVTRVFVEFDISEIPLNAEITEAKISFYRDPNSTKDPNNEGHSGENSFNIHPITSSWEDHSLTWNNQPTYDVSHYVNVPASAEPLQDYNSIDITSLVQSAVIDPAGYHGFMLKFVTEQPYKVSWFSSAENDDPTLSPKLEITYME